jgi:hypothetical protein
LLFEILHTPLTHFLISPRCHSTHLYHFPQLTLATVLRKLQLPRCIFIPTISIREVNSWKRNNSICNQSEWRQLTSLKSMGEFDQCNGELFAISLSCVTVNSEGKVSLNFVILLWMKLWFRKILE